MFEKKMKFKYINKIKPNSDDGLKKIVKSVESLFNVVLRETLRWYFEPGVCWNYWLYSVRHSLYALKYLI